MKRPLHPARLLADLVRRPSLSGQEEALADWLGEELAGRPFAVERVGNSLVCTLSRGAGPTLLCHSHLDTVAAGEGWTGDPHAGQWSAGRLVGLGANDAGASAVAMLCALESLAQADWFSGTLQVALCAEEETTNAGMGDVLAHLAARGCTPDGAICGEPTGLEVVRAQSGLAVLVAEWSGTSCHAARALAVAHENALLMAAREVAGLPPVLVLPGEHELLGPSTLVPAVFESGVAHNRVPDRARLILDARLAPPHGAAECVQILRTWLPSAQITIRSQRLAAVETTEEHPLVLAALEAAAVAQAGSAGSSGSTDSMGTLCAVGSATMSDMALVPEIPAVKCGPGLSERSHTPNEFVTATELEAGLAFYMRAMPAALTALTPEVAIP